MHGIVLANFGSTGFMRSQDWQMLSKDYARKVGRSFATLFVTGALKGTVVKDGTNPGGATVSMGNTGLVPYALAHHHGNPGNFGFTVPGSGDLPMRRVFPMDPANDQVTAEAAELVTRAAEAKVKELIK